LDGLIKKGVRLSATKYGLSDSASVMIGDIDLMIKGLRHRKVSGIPFDGLGIM
jgi:hypothetical protein